jgi:hypothetical protein
MIMEIFLGLASMSCSEMMKPRSFPAGILNTHFSRLILMWLVRRLAKVSSRSSINCAAAQDLTMMSST